MKIKTTQIVCGSSRPGVLHSGVSVFGSRISAFKMTLSRSGDERRLRLACQKILRQATLRTACTLCLSVPSMEGFPLRGLTRILAQELYRFLSRQSTSLKRINILPEDPGLSTFFRREINGYLQHVMQTLAHEPFVTVDIIIELDEGVVLIERSNPPLGWALPGGFVDRDESLEDAARREAKEETNLALRHLRQWQTYSDPGRDPRFHTISTVFVAQGVGRARAGDDAGNLRIVPHKKLLTQTYAFDHRRIIKDYLRQIKRTAYNSTCKTRAG